MEQGISVFQQGRLYRRKGTGSEYTGDYVTEQFYFGNATAGADNSIAGAVTGSKIRILSYSLSCVSAGAATVRFYSNPSATVHPISQTITLAANQFVSESSAFGLFETFTSESLVVVPTTNIVGVRVTWIYTD